MKNILIFFVSGLIALGIGASIAFLVTRPTEDPFEEKRVNVVERPLDKYTFDNLRKIRFTSNPIILGRKIDETENLISQIFYFDVNNLNGKKSRVSGMLNIPKSDGVYPIVVMFRGFVPKENYETGVGTKRVGRYFARNGFITIAPDFLGFGESENPSYDAMEERFQTYTTALSLFSSLQSLNAGLTASYSGKIVADPSKVGIWGHSNGGQIALSTLAISGASYPTVLWAPVSKPFPYSILFYTDEFEDKGKALRRILSNFESIYDVEKYSPSNFYSWIQAPLQIHQGIEDDEVPKKWSDQFVEDLEGLEKKIEYFVYPNSDHNLMTVGWDTAVLESMGFYRKHFEEEF